jgi:16S rRNA G966 N2-methylase RsmD
MINKIKNKIEQITHKLGLIHHKSILNRNSHIDHMALTQLLKMFDNNIFIPLTGWSISPNEVLHVCNDIIINNRRNIIEFGSGFSTICIAQLLKINNIETKFYSIENNQDWANDLNKIIERMNLKNYVEIIVSQISPISKEYAKEGQEKWYDTSILSEALCHFNNVGLVLVDGPYGGSTPFARYSAIPFLKNKLADNYAIFLDDSAREHEMKIAKDWKNLLNATTINYTRYTYLTNKLNFDIAPYGTDL